MARTGVQRSVTNRRVRQALFAHGTPLSQVLDGKQVVAQECLELHIGVLDESTVAAALGHADQVLHCRSQFFRLVTASPCLDEVGNKEADAHVLILQGLHAKRPLMPDTCHAQCRPTSLISCGCKRYAQLWAACQTKWPSRLGEEAH